MEAVSNTMYVIKRYSIYNKKVSNTQVKCVLLTLPTNIKGPSVLPLGPFWDLLEYPIPLQKSFFPRFFQNFLDNTSLSF